VEITKSIGRPQHNPSAVSVARGDLPAPEFHVEIDLILAQTGA
jgi:hypothetical protein